MVRKFHQNRSENTVGFSILKFSIVSYNFNVDIKCTNIFFFSCNVLSNNNARKFEVRYSLVDFFTFEGNFQSVPRH